MSLLLAQDGGQLQAQDGGQLQAQAPQSPGAGNDVAYIYRGRRG